MNWISVKDGLPKEDEDFVIRYKSVSFSGNDHFDIGYIKNNEIDRKGCDCCTDSISEITHWMPLPKGPDENK